MGRPPKSPYGLSQAALLNNAKNSGKTDGSSVLLFANLTSCPPNHPSEFVDSHRTFLQRSLDRCDAEIAALQKINIRLHQYKQLLTQTKSSSPYSKEEKDAILMNIANDENNDEAAVGGDDDKLLQKMFRDHLKLRRRLLNRLARRLNRVAHAMDNKNVMPPPPPKYGDVRSIALLEETDNQELESAKRNVAATRWQLRQKELSLLHEKSNTETSTKEQEATADTLEKQENVNETNNIEEEKEVDNPFEDEDKEKEDKDKENTSLKKEEEDSEEEGEIVESDIDFEAAAVESVVKKEKKEESVVVDREEFMKNDPLVLLLKSCGKDFDQLKTFEPMYDYCISKETGKKNFVLTKGEVSKLVNKTMEDFMEEQQDSQLRVGIGAVLRSMTPGEKESEWKRWCNDILGHTPSNQPSFREDMKIFFAKERMAAVEKARKDAEMDRQLKEEMFGATDDDESEVSTNSNQEELQHNRQGFNSDTSTINLDENENPSLKKKNNETPNEEKNDTMNIKDEKDKKSDKVTDSDDENDKRAIDSDESDTREMFGTDSSENEDEDDNDKMDVKKEDEKSKVEKIANEEDSTKDSSDKEKNEKAQESEEPVLKKRKIFSLKPIPSFYDQDRQRVNMIHADILHTKMHEYARRKIADATNEYNKCFRKSMEISTQKMQLETEWNKRIYQNKMEANRIRNDDAVALALARARWQKQKGLFEKEMRNKSKQFGIHHYVNDEDVVARTLTNTVDRVHIRNALQQCIIGTQIINDRASRARSIVSKAVLTTLGHMVDVTVKRTQTGWIPNDIVDGLCRETFPDFVPPTKTDIDEAAINKKTAELLNSSKKEITLITHKLVEAEAERKKAWSKLMKTKSELEIQPTKGRGNRQPVDMNSIPLPPLKGFSGGKSYAQPLPTFMLSTQTPPVMSDGTGVFGEGSGSKSSESKYSAEKVKARIYSDGSVMPVSMPKKNKDGLYQRPAGRKRKGMDWNAVTGRWVPTVEESTK